MFIVILITTNEIDIKIYKIYLIVIAHKRMSKSKSKQHSMIPENTIIITTQRCSADNLLKPSHKH